MLPADGGEPAPRRFVLRGRVVTMTGEDEVERFRSTLKEAAARGGAYIYHLAEGVDQKAYDCFVLLERNGLLASSLAAVHALALGPQDLSRLAGAGSKLLWSPLSNLVLYGETQGPRDIRDSGIAFAIGSDWSPTGSKNLLEELKVAWWLNLQDGSPLSAFDLARSVTAQAAETVGWHGRLGTLRPGMLADLLVLRGRAEDPYLQLIEATEHDVGLVVVGGVPRYGDLATMEDLDPGPLEELEVAGRRRAFHLDPEVEGRGAFREPDGRPGAFPSLAAATDLLTRALRDPRRFASVQVQRRGLTSATLEGHEEDLTLELDYGRPDDWSLVDWLTHRAPVVVRRVPTEWRGPRLDALHVDAEHLETVAKQPNLPSGLKDYLADVYTRRAPHAAGARTGGP